MDLKKIYRPYTPSRQDQYFLERTTTGRENLLSDLIASIEEQSLKPTHQHWLLVGPRGIGKSHIMALLQHRVKSNKGLNSKWLPVWFPEEAVGIITLRDFMEKVIQLSSEEMESEGLSDKAQMFNDILEVTHKETADRKAINRLRAFLLDWKSKNQRKILILLENADRVLGNRIAKKLPDEKWLRDLLMNKDLFLFIASSPTFFKQVLNKDRPLYELFKIEVIEDLSFKESLEMLIKYAKDEGRIDLVKEFETKTNRIQAIYTLTGGNPRLLIILYILIQDSVSNISDVEFGFFNLLEELTPYFQARLAQLGDKEEKILVAFAEGPELITPAEVGRKIRMPTNRVTANLKRLQMAGFIRRIEKPIKGRKGTLYRLSETIYRYWYQMNSDRNREMAEIFVRFIVLYYTYREIEQIYTSQSFHPQAGEETSRDKAVTSRGLHYLETAISISKEVETRRLYDLLKSKIEERAATEETQKVYQELIEVNPENYYILNSYAIFHIQKGDVQTAIDCFQQAWELAVKDEDVEFLSGISNNWGSALVDLARLKGDESLFQESFEKYALAVKYKKDKHEVYNNWGNALVDLARLKDDESLFQESFEKYALAVKYKKNKHEAYYNWGNVLSNLAKLKGDESLFQESFEKYALAVKYKKDKHNAYNNWGNALADLARLKGDESLFQESFEKYALATKYKKDNYETYNNWGTALSDLAGLKGDESLYKESFEKYALAIKYKKDDPKAYYNWGTTLSDLARLKGDENLHKQRFEKYALAWNLVKKLKWFDHPLMVNTALEVILSAAIVEKDDEADHIFIELIGSLSKIADLKSTTPFFFEFFKLLAKHGKANAASRYLEQLLKTKFKKELDVLILFSVLFQYLEQKDDSIIRRQPPEIQKILNEMIYEIEGREESANSS